MTKKQKQWVYRSAKPSKPTVPERIKAEVQAKANDLIEIALKPQHLKPPPEDHFFNYLVDIYGQWYRSYFYFCGKYHSPGPDALAPFFETKFARLEYVAPDQFNLAYMRHTGQWWEVYQGLSLEQGLHAIQNEALFWP